MNTKKLNTKLKKIGIGILITELVLLVVFLGFALVPFQGLDQLETHGGSFQIHLMAIEEGSPYSTERVVIRSNQFGHGYVDTTRTTWWYDESAKIADIYSYIDLDHSIHHYVNNDLRDELCWVDGVQRNFAEWSPGNRFYSPTGATIDPDGMKSGVPTLGVSIGNIYASDSNGDPDDSYDHRTKTLTLTDPEGNNRLVELHMGFVTLEIVYSIESETAKTILEDEDKLRGLLSETPGYIKNVNSKLNTLGEELEFESYFRFEINALDFGDDWELNPNWLELGNGIMDIYRRGFTPSYDQNEEEYQIATQDTIGWSFEGYDDIETRQNEAIDRFSTLDNALDKNKDLFNDESSVTNFIENTPTVVYFGLGNFVQLGLDYDTNFWGTTLIDSLQLQKISFTQQITIKFYTSVCEPLGGESDPIKQIVSIPPPPPPQERLWDKLINLIISWTGWDYDLANLVTIIVCIVLGTIVIVIGLSFIFPGFVPAALRMLGKAIKWAFMIIPRAYHAIKAHWSGG